MFLTQNKNLDHGYCRKTEIQNFEKGVVEKHILILKKNQNALYLFHHPIPQNLPLSISGSKLFWPVCLESSINRTLIKLTHPFSASKYCQRFITLTWLIRGLSRNPSLFLSNFLFL